MTREYFEFLLTCQFEYLTSSSVSMNDFEFMLENSDKDINTINID